ncbi:MAG: immunogenic protein [Lachnoanaerobaculum sp.]|uniref:immunogenic protein n=1 Tax=Lachnoanaerobaculum sp. TaxID=2049030 RepID=UPI0025BCFA22|nr:immunogenic protein [Lachnoanaerobaculum sp.]MBS5882380.1 immunogenic protein [Lachnoanaerobaculum sp.]
MKRFIIYVLSLMLLLNVAGCAKKEENKAEESSLKNYSELSNGTYSCDEHIYKYRFEISGRMPNAAKNSTFVYLSNLSEISFEQAWRASGLSSSLDDYFSEEDAILVDIK